MTPRDALIELVERVGARHGAAVLISEEELRQWPADAVSAMQSHRLLARARPAKDVVCPGCEWDCVMPVQTMPAGSGGPLLFIVCDTRSDINRVAIAPERVAQWKCDAEAIARFVAGRLGLRRSGRRSECSGMLHIGIAAGDTRRQMLCLRTHGDVALVAADKAVPLADLVDFGNGDYAMDTDAIRQLGDSAKTADQRYTQSTARREARKLDTQALHKRWRKAHRDLRRSRPNMSKVWYAEQIAKQEIAVGRTAATIRKHLTA